MADTCGNSRNAEFLTLGCSDLRTGERSCWAILGRSPTRSDRDCGRRSGSISGGGHRKRSRSRSSPRSSRCSKAAARGRSASRSRAAERRSTQCRDDLARRLHQFDQHAFTRYRKFIAGLRVQEADVIVPRRPCGFRPARNARRCDVSHSMAFGRSSIHKPDVVQRRGVHRRLASAAIERLHQIHFHPKRAAADARRCPRRRSHAR
jgi:hypothetical protein